MKKLIILIFSLVLLYVSVNITINEVDKYYGSRINKYYDNAGRELATEKNQGLLLQEMGLERKDNLSIYGSSELSGIMIPSHPDNFYRNKEGGFQINLIGRGYCQSIIDAINFGALGNKMSGKKVAIILSPQWFTQKGLTSDEFSMNVSEIQFYALMANKNIDNSLKLRICSRVLSLTSNSSDFTNLKFYSYLYSKNNFVSRIALDVLMPYYNLKYKLVTVKDKVDTYKFLKGYENTPEYTKANPINIDWNKEYSLAEEQGKKETNNNDFAIINDYYNSYIKDSLLKDKDSYKDLSYSESPEYDDLKLLLDICKSQGIKPLLIGVPVHGQWYDYCGFDKARRQEYYTKVGKIINSYGFEYEDLSKYEYEKYFLKDIMHLGWKGWLHVDEALSRYYHEN